MDEYTETPHKKWGKNHSKSSPNSKGCTGNDQNEHVYGRFVQWWFAPTSKEWWPHSFALCIGCGRRQNYKDARKTLQNEPVAHVLKRAGILYMAEMRNGKPVGYGAKLTW